MKVKVQKYFDIAPRYDRKTFMIWVENNVPKKYKGYVKNKYFGISNNYIKYGSKDSPAYKKLKDMGIPDYKSIFDNTEEIE